MPKGSKKDHRPPQRRVWEPNDVTELLAYLDYCLERGIDFESTVIGHMRNVTGKDFSQKQISRKLKSEWDQWGREGLGTVQDLLSEGSTFLVGYTEDDREDIREAISRLGPPADRYRFKSTSSVSTSRSRTMSKPRQLSGRSTLSLHATPEFEDLNDVQAGPGEERVVDENVCTSHIPRHPDQANLETLQVDTEASRGLRSGLWGKGASQNNNSIATLPTEIKGEVYPLSEPSSCTDRLMPSASTGYTYVHSAAQMTPLATESENLIRSLKRELAGKTDELETTRRENMEQKNYIFTLSNQLSAAQMECKEIRHSTRNAALHKDDHIMQRDLRYENSVLKDELAKMRSQRQGFMMAETDSLRPSDKTIQDGFDLIRIDIRDACSSVDVATLISVDIQNAEHDNGAIDSWAQRLAHCSFSKLVSSALESSISELEMTRSLAAVGVCDLVFESCFPNFIATESPILDQYRKHVLTRGTNTSIS